jgi:hypothetical protein
MKAEEGAVENRAGIPVRDLAAEEGLNPPKLLVGLLPPVNCTR